MDSVLEASARVSTATDLVQLQLQVPVVCVNLVFEFSTRSSFYAGSSTAINLVQRLLHVPVVCLNLVRVVSCLLQV